MKKRQRLGKDLIFRHRAKAPREYGVFAGEKSVPNLWLYVPEPMNIMYLCEFIGISLKG